MAAATYSLGTIFGAVAILNYDDVSLTASSITFSAVSGIRSVTINVQIQGQNHTATANIGQTSVITFSPSITVSFTTVKGVLRLVPDGIINMQGVAI